MNPHADSVQQPSETLAREILEICRGWSQATFGWQGDDPDGFSKASRAHDEECIRRIVAALARFGTRPAAEPYQQALEIRIAQGWQLGGNACPVLYTDTINGEQVCRDDLWLATTAGLKGAAEPIQSGSAGEADLRDQLAEAKALADSEGTRAVNYLRRARKAEAALSRQAPAAPAEAVWANFPSYLIDHCEGATITEEGLQRWLAAMLKDQKYAAPTPTAPTQALLGWTRYEKARKLNPAQWAELHQRNLKGENFDDMIDALPATTQPVQQDTSHLPRFVVNGVYQNGRHFSRRFDSAADRDDWLEAEGFENMAEFKCSEEPQ